MPNEPDENSLPASRILQGATELAKVIPIYQDALQPMMKETGKALSVVGRAVNVALFPIRGVVWGAEKVEEWLSTKVEEKLAKASTEDIVTPDLAIAGPVIESLRFNGHKPELSDMYASLLAGSMLKSSQMLAHPTFVEKIRSMTTLDAKIFEVISAHEGLPTIHIERVTVGVEGSAPVVEFFSPVLFEVCISVGFEPKGVLQVIQGSIENLADLGLVLASNQGHLTSDGNKAAYKEIEDGQICQSFRDMSVHGEFEFTFRKTFVRLTQTGKNFKSITSL
jgi:Abortive infection alpha